MELISGVSRKMEQEHAVFGFAGSFFLPADKRASWVNHAIHFDAKKVLVKNFTMRQVRFTSTGRR